ncbi:glutamate transport system permease protein [Tessaracoccus bendigoensis DSM 12906]|uniref:Glutamate transport system permease protein n=1 Tax=Tessaracoccus bendigoensis DSM 12906 TaxID=1123357 RepID=A0A1M6LUE6_9ACTN|nr:amino acid ABC transporter permease [Tessaracoccus bendigoensis]SHJ74791.1 glutamate transport system permease protein [Tessaracoccus bendigoensis DSM 12906]
MSASSVLYDAPGPKARRLSRIASTVILVGLVGLVVWFVWRVGQPRTTVNGAVLSGVWDPSRWDIFQDKTVWEDLLWRGLVMGTLRAAGLAAVLALIVGVLLCFARSARSALIRVPTTIVLEFFRGLPVLLMMLFIMLAVGTNGYWAVVVALTIYNGAIIGEALRAGIAALPKGQREAGLSLGLTGTATKLLIEFPQAFRQMLPIIVAQLVVLLKDTSLAYVVAYPEILRKADSLKQFYGNRYAFSLFFVVLAVYLIVNFALSALARWLSKRTGPKSEAALITQNTRTMGQADD